MNIGIDTQKENITVEGRGFSRREVAFTQYITFENGCKVSFSSFVNECMNNRWCTNEEINKVRNTTSLAKKHAFAVKYAEQFISVPGRSF